MSLTRMTGTALILSTLIYHGGLVFLFARSQFLEVLIVPHREKLLIIARHIKDYRCGNRIILIGWIVAVLGYVMLTALLRDAGDPMISTLASVLFLIAIVSSSASGALGLTCNVQGDYPPTAGTQQTDVS